MPAEVVLMMDLSGVLSSSPFPAARRLAERMMSCIFTRAGSHLAAKMKNRSVRFLARQYCNFFFTVTDFTERIRGIKSAFERLELGEINRVEFVTEYRLEMKFMLDALGKQNMEELEGMSISHPKRVASLKKRFPLLVDPIVQSLVYEIMDVEAFLCTIEKVSPRKNVLNLLHYLHVKSQQEIRLFAMGNSWETEGQYKRMLHEATTSVVDSVSSVFPVTCPVLYGDGPSRKATFNVNGLFDGYVRSYTCHKRKPYPDIFMKALEQVKECRKPTADALRFDLKPFVFYFDDVGDHCEAARDLPGNPFTEAYLIEDGAADVFKDVIAALKIVAAKDVFWKSVVESVERDMTPLFRPPTDAKGRPVSWVEGELNNYQDNLLFIPPPHNDSCVPVSPLERKEYQMGEDDQEAILYYCAQHLPHLFPLNIPDQPSPNMGLKTQPGLATSAGPILFEYFKGSKYFESYRITLRTGSFVLRIQPQGPNPYGSVDIRREFETMSHLSAVAPAVKVPGMLLYCDSYAVCGRRFYIRRYVDGEVISNIQTLLQPRIQRPYSERRRIVNVELKPKLFFWGALNALTALHNAPAPRFMKQTATTHVHPALNRIHHAMERYKRTISTTKLPGFEFIRSSKLEELAAMLTQCFDQTQLVHQIVPFPERLVIVHGHFDMSVVCLLEPISGRTAQVPSSTPLHGEL
ncbi:hypothetical protein AGDE_15573 [Angomonas deanei]|uniref:Phosphotransferase enzyme family, putative n=1 Tax=Angomonas deanei TaxID=59799 RepID=A0A7G2C1Q6_9TRYP|nr:hypothetical protein AGDE_15573 [Angomonas deanei]CAD2212653.1 Phosphotransferase enzyme family, putative [Angomonas deanei]|eukprot:EPY18830.1 hypothetical protein AGDE_15573 [Angomonas deanei]